MVIKGECRHRQDASARPRRARLPARRRCACWLPAAASSRASLGTTGSSGPLFEPLLASVSADLRAELLSGPGVAVLVKRGCGGSTLHVSQEAPAEGSFAILHGLYWLAANLAFQHPTLLAIDDLHAGAFPLAALASLPDAKAGGSASAGRGRDAAAGRRGAIPRLSQELVADPEATAMRPEPLGRASIAVLARELRGLEPDEAFCAALETATGGKPALRRRGAGRGGQGGDRPDRRAGATSAGDRGAGRVSRGRAPPRSPAAGGACSSSAASILGDGAELRHAAALANVEASELGPAADALSRLDLLRREDPLEFFHPVVRSAVYGTLDVAERDAAHRSAAELLLGSRHTAPRMRQVRSAPPCHSSRRVRGLDAAPSSRTLPLAEGAADAAVGWVAGALEEHIDTGCAGGDSGRASPCGAADERPGGGRPPARRS